MLKLSERNNTKIRGDALPSECTIEVKECHLQILWNHSHRINIKSGDTRVLSVNRSDTWGNQDIVIIKSIRGRLFCVIAHIREVVVS